MIHKSILDIPYNGDLNWFSFSLGYDTYLSDEDGICIYSCLPGIIDPDTSNDWYKELESWEEPVRYLWED